MSANNGTPAHGDEDIIFQGRIRPAGIVKANPIAPKPDSMSDEEGMLTPAPTSYLSHVRLRLGLPECGLWSRGQELGLVVLALSFNAHTAIVSN